jgi:hypothetical protein
MWHSALASPSRRREDADLSVTVDVDARMARFVSRELDGALDWLAASNGRVLF